MGYLFIKFLVHQDRFVISESVYVAGAFDSLSCLCLQILRGDFLEKLERRNQLALDHR